MMTTQGKKPSGPDAGENDAKLGRDVQTKIGEGLRAMYDDIVRQGVPDRFAKLLEELDQPGRDKTPAKQTKDFDEA
jgi:hypothetical protein